MILSFTEDNSMSQADELFPIFSNFLNRLSYLQDFPESSKLVSFDMVVLYPNIRHEERIDIMRTFLNEGSDKPISTESLCRLAEIVLKENYFELGDEIFHQLLGAAIGTKFAPTDANIFMAGLERKLFSNNKFNPFLWLQFLYLGRWRGKVE